jgi:Flp pilus assembly protein TadD
VKHFKAGDRVLALSNATYAELVAVDDSDVTHLPDGVDLANAAAIPLISLTGDQLVRLATNVKKGQVVLITGAPGSVGRAAVHTAKKIGAQVIAGVRGKESDDARSLGVSDVLAIDDDKAIEKFRLVDAAHNSLAFLLDGFDWDFDSAGKEFQRAIELNPGYATAHHLYAWHLSLLGRYDDAIAEMRKAESLDPLSLIINADLAEILVLAHSYDESIRQSRKTIDMDPNFALAHNQLVQAYLQKHMYDEAVAELQKAVQLSGDSPTCVASLARAYVASGKKTKAVKLLSDLKKRSIPRYSNASEIATIYASLGDTDQAMTWLEKGYEERFNPSVLLRPGFDPLRSDPRFQNLVHRIGLLG